MLFYTLNLLTLSSYERREYESVDERAYLGLCPEQRRKKKNSGGKGLKIIANNTRQF